MAGTAETNFDEFKGLRIRGGLVEYQRPTQAVFRF